MAGEKKETTHKNKMDEPKSTHKKVKTDTTSVSVIDTKELNSLIEEDLESDKAIFKPKKHLLVHSMLILLLLISLGAFGITLYDKTSSAMSVMKGLFITIFTILFVVVSITYKRNDKSLILIGSLLLAGYFIFNSLGQMVSIDKAAVLPNFSGRSVTEVMKCAKENKIVVNQEYEYTDMIQEYGVISQSIPAGEKLSQAKELVVSISEGPNPSKEIMVPNMITWDSERVLQFIKNNYLSNVLVEFMESDKARDTVIEQSASGSFKRDDELKLIFSLGEELGEEEISLIDFTNKSKFEVEFYMKQHQLKYTFSEEFSADIKKGYAVSQSVHMGEKVKANETEIQVIISKGPEIKVPDLTKYSMEDVSEWAIQNKVKINFSNQYDESIKENNVVSANYKEGDIIEQGTVVKVVISRGNLKMPKFDSLNDFYDWANQYSISYEEVHEFSDTIKAGEVISYSYKEGETIKNNDTITVKISDGVKKTVPNVVGLTRSEAISKLDKAGFKYSFTYRNNSASKDKVLSQSIRAGSEVSSGTTITITLSNGKAETTPVIPTPTPTPTPQPTCESVKVYIDGSHIKNDPAATCSTIKSAYPTLKFTCSYVCGPTNGLLLNGDAEIDDHTFTTCDTITLRIADSNKC